MKPVLGDFTTLRQLARGMGRSQSHADNLQAFYAPQARHYDRFRERLLHGRAELVEALRLKPGERVVELGAGTGRVAAYYAEQVPALASLTLVDLCTALLSQARDRTANWPRTQVVQADITHWQPLQPVDKVYCSYALTMVPDWYLAIDNAVRMLRPGGLLGVVDFQISRPRAPDGLRQHSALARWFWCSWFAHDGVMLSGDHLPYLQSRLATVCLRELEAPVPWLPGLKAPYYLFVGRKRRED